MGRGVGLPDQQAREVVETTGDRWWDGRQVAIRPDVPSRDFDPEDLVLVKSDDERVRWQNRINSYIAEHKRAAEADLWPSWLSERPERPAQD